MLLVKTIYADFVQLNRQQSRGGQMLSICKLFEKKRQIFVAMTSARFFSQDRRGKKKTACHI